jgi:hypothetical protein
LTRNEAPVLIFSGKIFIGLQKLFYVAQAKLLKGVRIYQFCKAKLGILEKKQNNSDIISTKSSLLT